MFAFPPASIPARSTDLLPIPQDPQPQPSQHPHVAPQIVQTVSVEQTPARSDLLLDTEQWTWVELRDYVAAQIVERFGPFPRDSRKEYGIFNRFFNEYGQRGIRVAQHAFGPACDGWWGGAPISVNRFCKASDPYFVQPILQRLADTTSPSTA